MVQILGDEKAIEIDSRAVYFKHAQKDANRGARAGRRTVGKG